MHQRSEQQSPIAENMIPNNSHSQQFSRNWTSLKLCGEQTMTAWRHWVWQEKKKKHQSFGKYGAYFEGPKSRAHQPNHINANAHIVEKKWRDICTSGWQLAREKIPRRDYCSWMTFRSLKGCQLWFSVMRQAAVNTHEDVFALLRHVCNFEAPSWNCVADISGEFKWWLS